MNLKYQEWIDFYVKENNGNVRTLCQSATSKMVKIFPELRRERGYVNFDSGYSDEHWWCVDSENNIIDPTVLQFKEKISSYEPYNEEIHGPLPTGKCYDCGSYLYNHESFCDKTCENNTLNYLNSSPLERWGK